MHPEQDSICVGVCEGESHKVKNNILIGYAFDVGAEAERAHSGH